MTTKRLTDRIQVIEDCVRLIRDIMKAHDGTSLRIDQ